MATSPISIPILLLPHTDPDKNSVAREMVCEAENPPPHADGPALIAITKRTLVSQHLVGIKINLK